MIVNLAADGVRAAHLYRANATACSFRHVSQHGGSQRHGQRSARLVLVMTTARCRQAVLGANYLLDLGSADARWQVQMQIPGSGR